MKSTARTRTKTTEPTDGGRPMMKKNRLRLVTAGRGLEWGSVTRETYTDKV